MQFVGGANIVEDAILGRDEGRAGGGEKTGAGMENKGGSGTIRGFWYSKNHDGFEWFNWGYS